LDFDPYLSYISTSPADKTIRVTNIVLGECSDFTYLSDPVLAVLDVFGLFR
jgi:hypothetical protein